TTVTITTRNAQGMTDSQPINVTVLPSLTSLRRPSDSEPAVKSNTSVTARMGEEFRFQVLVENASDATELLVEDTLPLGLVWDPVEGIISGTINGTEDGDMDAWDTYNVVLSSTDPPLTPQTETLLELIFTPADSDIPVINSPTPVSSTIAPDSFTLVPGEFFSYIVTSTPQADSFAIIGTLPPDLSFFFDGEDWKLEGIYNPGGSALSRVRESRPRSKIGSLSPGFLRSFNSIDTIRIRPPCIAYDGFTADNASGSATRPANFFEAATVSRVTYGNSDRFDVNLPFSGDARASGPGIECRNSGNSRYQVVFNFPAGIEGPPQLKVEHDPDKRAKGTLTLDDEQASVSLQADDEQIVTLRLQNVDTGPYVYPELVVQMGILIGDTDANGTVEAADLPTHPGTVTAENYREDVNADGIVDQRDRRLVTRNLGHTLFP
ncbi:MAG TPA: hypothetical protein VIL63_08885, partial [Terriglobales bacterium]